MSEDRLETPTDISITASGAQDQGVTTRMTAEPDDADHATETADQERRGYLDEPTTS